MEIRQGRSEFVSTCARCRRSRICLARTAPGRPGRRVTRTRSTYVMNSLDPSYWTVSTQPFEATVFTELADPELTATPPANPAWVVNQDFFTMEFSGSGSFTGADRDHRLYRANRAGERLELRLRGRGLPSGRGQPGWQDRRDPARNLRLRFEGGQRQNHGAEGVLLFNEGTLGDPDRNGPIGGTLVRLRRHDPRCRVDVRGRPLPGGQPDRHGALAVLGQIEVFDTLQRDRGVGERTE